MYFVSRLLLSVTDVSDNTTLQTLYSVMNTKTENIKRI